MSSHIAIDYLAFPSRSLEGAIQVPGDKSISHRAIILGSVAEGVTCINGVLKSEDIATTINVIRNLGVQIDDENEQIFVHGVGKHGLQASNGPLNFNNSGTSVRLMTGLLAGQEFNSILIGDESLSSRPMGRIVQPLMKMGSDISCSAQGTLPIQIRGGKRLSAISHEMPVASAQLKSCLLIAGLYAQGTTNIYEPGVTRDHTERMLATFGLKVSVKKNCIGISPQTLQAATINIPGDISSAAFFLVAASICPGSDLILKNVGINATRSAVIKILILMGADIDVVGKKEGGEIEPIADIRVKHSHLKGIVIPDELVSVAIDEFPIIMVAAAYAKGKTVLKDAVELRVKESDRIEAIANGLKKIGIDVTSREDGMTVIGGVPKGGEVDSFGDHRIAMAFTIAAANAKAPIKILDCINVNTSFPNFLEIASSIGINVKPKINDN